MEAILAWQLGVVATIIIARLFSSGAMTLVALAWTAFTFLAVWANALVVLQLGSVWGSVWLLTALFGETVETEVKTVPPSKEQKVQKATIYAPREILTAKTKNSTAAATSVSSTISAIADATTSFAEGLTQALDDASQTLRLQQDTLKTNSNLYIQLSTLKSSIQLALVLAKSRRKLTGNAKTQSLPRSTSEFCANWRTKAHDTAQTDNPIIQRPIQVNLPNKHSHKWHTKTGSQGNNAFTDGTRRAQ